MTTEALEPGLTVPDEPGGRAGTSPRRGWLAPASVAVAGVLALVPVVRMGALVREASPLQYGDYWEMLEHFAEADGSLSLSGLFEFQNHPVVVAQFVYWVNMQLFAGSNNALGYFDVLVDLGVLAVLGVLLFRTPGRRWARLGAFVVASCLLFTPVGTWNFVKSMSGTAWFTANLFALLALYARSRGRTAVAFGTAVLAAVSYGTGLLVWPSLVAVGLVLRRPREWWRELPFVAGFLVTFVWYRVAADGPGLDSPTPVGLVGDVAELLALPLGSSGAAARLVGLALLSAIVALGLWCTVRVRTESAAAWVGVAAFGLLCIVEMAVGRQDVLDAFGVQHRYASLASLAWIGFIGLALTAMADAEERRRDDTGGWGRYVTTGGSVATVAVVLAIGLLTTMSGDRQVEELRTSWTDQEVRGIALRLGVGDTTPALMGFAFATGSAFRPSRVLEATHNHPYVDSWDRDCGLLDQVVAPVSPPAGRAAGAVRSSTVVPLLRRAVLITGRVARDLPVRCVLVLDEDERVVGAGVLDRDGDGPAGKAFTALARPGSPAYGVVAVFEGDDRPVRVGNGPVRPSA